MGYINKFILFYRGNLSYNEVITQVKSNGGNLGLYRGLVPFIILN